MKIRKVECEICGEKNKSVLDVHHMMPRSCGGGNERSNLMVACANCHRMIHNHLIRLEGHFLTTCGKHLFWYKTGENYNIRPGYILHKDGTAELLES